MSKLDIVRALYDYNEWADSHVIEAASRLTADEFSRKQGASFESVEGNLAHIVGRADYLAPAVDRRLESQAGPRISEDARPDGYPGDVR